ncbi:MAG: response regulator [Planctomycetes bacterium]|nr:response regulator [Planctomycetota bacterium]
MSDELDVLFEHSIDLLAVADLDGYFKRLSPSWEKTLGWKIEEILAQPWLHFVHPDDRQATIDVAANQAKGAPVLEFENRYRCKDGSYRWISWRVAAPAPGSTRLYAVARDLTERRSRQDLEVIRTGLEASIAERERYAVRLIARSAVTSALAGGDSFEEVAPRILKAICESMHWTHGEVWTVKPRGEAVEFVRGWHSPDAALDEFENAARGSPWPFGTGISGKVAAGGKAIWLEDGVREAACPRSALATSFGLHSASGFPILNENKVSAVMVFFSRRTGKPDADVVPMMADMGSQVGQFLLRTSLRAQLEQSQKVESIGRLAGGIAHDFNNLLTVINGYSESLIEELPPGDRMQDSLKEILAAGNRAAALTHQLLAFSRSQILVPRVLDINVVVQSMEQMLKRLIGEDIDLKSSLARGLDPVKADHGQLEQVIMNLAVNARDAMPNGGHLTLETANVQLDEAYARAHTSVTPGPYVMLAISDNGTGMDRSTQDHLFEPFFTTKEKGKGTGLGLATVHGIIKQSGGNIWVYSEPGKGTTFKIYFPSVSESVAHPAPAAARDIPRGSETLLLVEDEPAVRKLACTVLRGKGYAVLEAGSGPEAIEIFMKQSDQIRLLVTDVVMPGLSGRDLHKRLIELKPNLPVLYVSGYTSNAIVHHGVLDQGINFLQKPFTAEGLARKIREVLDARSG